MGDQKPSAPGPLLMAIWRWTAPSNTTVQPPHSPDPPFQRSSTNRPPPGVRGRSPRWARDVPEFDPLQFSSPLTIEGDQEPSAPGPLLMAIGVDGTLQHDDAISSSDPSFSDPPPIVLRRGSGGGVPRRVTPFSSLLPSRSRGTRILRPLVPFSWRLGWTAPSNTTVHLTRLTLRSAILHQSSSAGGPGAESPGE
ncbi:hypothetical protein J2129_001788 [Methanofollis sp. W23]|nr:hypothetical protein [Methanofollis sp. W23]